MDDWPEVYCSNDALSPLIIGTGTGNELLKSDLCALCIHCMFSNELPCDTIVWFLVRLRLGDCCDCRGRNFVCTD